MKTRKYCRASRLRVLWILDCGFWIISEVIAISGRLDNLSFLNFFGCYEAIHEFTFLHSVKSGSRHAGVDCRHPGPQGYSGDIRVDLDFSTPCWNDAMRGSV